MIIVANWKAYVGEVERAKNLFSISKRLSRKTKCKIVLAPPAPILGALAKGNRSRVAFAAQDISTTAGGARTGDVTAGAFSSSGATYAIIGHSERRAAGDTDAVISEKLSCAIKNGLTPILCVGENERDNEGKYLSVVREEITSAIEPLNHKERSKIVIAYEPLWAIGKTSIFAIKPNDLAEMILYIRKILAELIPGKNPADSVVLYGGSVEPENINKLSHSSGIDGFLIGHASTDPEIFSSIVKQLVLPKTKRS